MNERLKELYDQAIIVEGNGDYVAGELDPFKFAELIIRECVKVAVFKDSGMVASADVAGYMAAGRSTAARMIKEHFGVEE